MIFKRYFTAIATAAMLTFVPITAHADSLAITILNATANTPMTYTLSDSDTRRFRVQWDMLKATQDMVPLAPSSSYQGLRIDDKERNLSIRLYFGIGSMDRREAGRKRDEDRGLERWLLTKAPAPLGPTLVAALDRAIPNAASSANTPLREPANRNKSLRVETQKVQPALLKACKTRAHDNELLLVTCLQEGLHNRLGTEAYSKALGQLATESEPSAPAATP